MRLEIPDHLTDENRRAQALAAKGRLEDANDAYRAHLEQLDKNPAQSATVLNMWAIIIDDPHEKLAVNQEALRRADNAPDFPGPLRASLLANLGYSQLTLGDHDAARSWYLQAREAAAGLADDDYGAMVRDGIT